MRLRHIYRHPVKGLTPESLAETVLETGAGIAYDRACGFTSGNLPDPPVAGGWVPARTFIQLTAYPELARFRSRLDETDGSVLITAPDGDSAVVRLGDEASATAANDLIARHFAAGPHGSPALHVQTRPRGHWDFTDTATSILNLASLAALEETAGQRIDARRFRANLHIDGLQAWAEFGLVGGRYRLGEAVIDVTRPAMRCAATAADPDTGDTSLDVPALLSRTNGHLFFAVYGRVIAGGAIRAGDRLERTGDMAASPIDNLPPRTPDPRLWPRVYDAEREGTGLRLTSPLKSWPLPQAKPGNSLKLHPGLAHSGDARTLPIESADGNALVIAMPAPLTAAGKRFQIIASGPRTRESAS